MALFFFTCLNFLLHLYYLYDIFCLVRYNISLRNGSWSKDDLYSRFFFIILVSWAYVGVLRQKYIQEICFLSHSYDTGDGMFGADSNFISPFSERNYTICDRVSHFNLTTKCWIFYAIHFVFLCKLKKILISKLLYVSHAII